MPKFKVTLPNGNTDTLEASQALIDLRVSEGKFLSAEPIQEETKQDEKIVTAEFKGDKDFPQQTFTGTKKEVEEKAKKVKSPTSDKVGINPVNLFYEGSNTAGVVPEASTKPEDVMTNNDISTLDTSSLPDSLKNDPTFTSLSEEQKQIVAATYLANTALTDADKAQWLSAIEQAKKLVEPFYAQQLTIAQDEILRGFDNIEVASKMRLDLIERNIARINEDLETGTDRLDIDQQAQLTRLKGQYENTLVDLQNQVSDSGLAFNSRAGDLLSRAAIKKKDVQTSTTRSFGRRAEDLNKQAGRSLEDQEASRLEAEELRKQNLTSLAREAEKTLGTEGFTKLTSDLDSSLKDILGDNLGGIKGTLEQQKTSDILSTANQLKGVGDFNL